MRKRKTTLKEAKISILRTAINDILKAIKYFEKDLKLDSKSLWKDINFISGLQISVYRILDRIDKLNKK